MPKKVYVAGASREIARAEGWMQELRAAGIAVVSTWPEVIRKVAEAMKLDHNVAAAANPMNASREERAGWASVDLNEVGSATIFWLLLPDGKPSEGACTELGCALMLAAASKIAREQGLNAPDYQLVCSGVETSIFTALADHFPTDDAAFAAIIAS
jgi:hypothetical protein